jgi:TPR repeat protein
MLRTLVFGTAFANKNFVQPCFTLGQQVSLRNMQISAFITRSCCSAICLLTLLAVTALSTGCGPTSKFKSTLEKAKSGDPQAQMEVGQMYLEGRDVKLDGAKGLNWIMQAAQKGLPAAERTYGLILRVAPTGGGTAGQARQWLEKAAAKGDVIAQVELGSMLGLSNPPFEYVEAMKWLLIAERSGATNATAMVQAVSGKMSPAEISQARAKAAAFEKEK